MADKQDEQPFASLYSFFFIPTPKNGNENEITLAFEISDGENMICWQVTAPPRVYGLLQNGEVPFSPQGYDLFTRQLAVLIAERTGLPLYDFRPPEQKVKEKKRNRP